MYFVLTIVCYGVIFVTTDAAVKTDYYNLYNAGFSNYNHNIRPVAIDTQVTKIYTSFRLISINELQEKDQVLISFGYLTLQWHDDFLAWDMNNYGGIDTLVVPQNEVWKPDLVVGNSNEKRSKLGFDEMPIRLNADGTVLWTPSVLFQTSCDINVKYYPFDQQVCSITLETMVSDLTEIDLIVGNFSLSSGDMMFEYGPNGEWDLANIEIAKKDEITKAGIIISLTINRRTTFYVLNIIVPVVCLALLLSTVFALPADSGEKISLAVTILLGYILFLSILSSDMPQTSLQVSVLAVYIALLVFFSALSVLLSIIILRIYHKKPGHGVPGIIKGMLRWRCLLCRRKSNQNDISPVGDTQTRVTYVGNDDDFEATMVTWQEVSESLDTFCFWSYLIISSLATIICLSIIMT
ncbi:hypothetical protein SNE40_000186 [Patella caerulea]|uniref:Uncharacterized protein n=1 Tax=Patella caerulea TaxID=87958 RepID=A0AAN8KGF3_PATCE